MSFNTPESRTKVNIKLTDAGRRQLSLGNLQFDKLVVSDREINYSIDPTENYNILNNRILSPSDNHPGIEPVNFDGSKPILLNNRNVTPLKQFLTADTVSYGFLTGSTNAWTFKGSLLKNYVNIAYIGQSWDNNIVTFTGAVPSVGDLIYCAWLPPQFSNGAIPSSFPVLPLNEPINGLFYKAISINGGDVTVDRPIPKFDDVSHSMFTGFYPSNGIDNYYGSGVTQNTSVWNLNIVRTHTIAGTPTSTNGISGYTSYGSLPYNGTKQYFGFGPETPAIGFIHYTNEFTGNTFGEQLIEKSVEVHMPTIMWHKTAGVNGEVVKNGASFYDISGSTYNDSIAKTSYRHLRDTGNTKVGRVYHKLKLIVITDQELLAALSYKSNRTYTYPEIITSLTPSPLYPLSSLDATGLCKNEYTYFVTLLYENDPYDASASFGFPDALHSMYIKKIQGQNDINGNPQFLKISFPPNSFPYMRNDSLISSEGTGWNANSVQVLISEQPTINNYNIANVPSDSWKRVSSLSSGGNGVYRASDAGDLSIDPVKLNDYSFIISRQDFESGSTYVLSTAMTSNQQYLNFGDESVFFGNVKAKSLRTVYKGFVTAILHSTQLNASYNSTYNPYVHNETYISEIAVLDGFNNVVAVGKPTYPLKKEVGKVLAIQLEIDF